MYRQSEESWSPIVFHELVYVLLRVPILVADSTIRQHAIVTILSQQFYIDAKHLAYLLAGIDFKIDPLT